MTYSTRGATAVLALPILRPRPPTMRAWEALLWYLPPFWNSHTTNKWLKLESGAAAGQSPERPDCWFLPVLSQVTAVDYPLQGHELSILVLPFK